MSAYLKKDLLLCCLLQSEEEKELEETGSLWKCNGGAGISIYFCQVMAQSTHYEEYEAVLTAYRNCFFLTLNSAGVQKRRKRGEDQGGNLWFCSKKCLIQDGLCFPGHHFWRVMLKGWWQDVCKLLYFFATASKLKAAKMSKTWSVCHPRYHSIRVLWI